MLKITVSISIYLGTDNYPSVPKVTLPCCGGDDLVEARENIAGFLVEGFGNRSERRNTRAVVAVLDSVYGLAINPRALCESALRKAALSAQLTNRFANCGVSIRTGFIHSLIFT